MANFARTLANIINKDEILSSDRLDTITAELMDFGQLLEKGETMSPHPIYVGDEGRQTISPETAVWLTMGASRSTSFGHIGIHGEASIDFLYVVIFPPDHDHPLSIIGLWD